MLLLELVLLYDDEAEDVDRYEGGVGDVRSGAPPPSDEVNGAVAAGLPIVSLPGKPSRARLSFTRFQKSCSTSRERRSISSIPLAPPTLVPPRGGGGDVNDDDWNGGGEDIREDV